ncbi:helix-turn-helix domain-containing protein [Actinokineospora pegani]|uniref:helix-turn-helix domain-containing protein n=1 Tax=Actinokineospora pegani TaxID=2654637 RepID=UPI0018D32FA3|nr:helix-turn-helix transcriptional regulator [Actinokineospora pegani]
MQTTTPTPDKSKQDFRPKNVRALLLSRELDHARDRGGITTRELATQLGTSASMVNRFMLGRRVPDPLQIGGLCAALDIPAERRHYLYSLATDASDLTTTPWILAPSPDTDAIVINLLAIAEQVTTYTPTLPAPTTPRRSTTHCFPASALHNPDKHHLRQLAHRHYLRLIPDTGPTPAQPFHALRTPHTQPIAIVELDHHTLILERHDAAPYITSADAFLTTALSPKDTGARIQELL